MSKKAFKRIFFGFIALYFVIFAASAIYDLITFEDMDIAENSNIYYGAEKAIYTVVRKKQAMLFSAAITPPKRRSAQLKAFRPFLSASMSESPISLPIQSAATRIMKGRTP